MTRIGELRRVPWRGLLAAGTVVLALSAGLANSTGAAPGDLDPTFGVSGKVTTTFGGDDQAPALVLQPDGKLVAAGEWNGNFALARYEGATPTPVAAVMLNSSVFHTGQTITYQAALTPGSTPTQVAIYLGVLLPDGMTFLSFVPGPGDTIAFAFGLVPVPFAANVTLTPTVVPFAYTFTGTEPVGTYYTYAGLAVTGSDPLQAANQLSLGV